MADTDSGGKPRADGPERTHGQHDQHGRDRLPETPTTPEEEPSAADAAPSAEPAAQHPAHTRPSGAGTSDDERASAEGAHPAEPPEDPRSRRGDAPSASRPASGEGQADESSASDAPAAAPPPNSPTGDGAPAAHTAKTGDRPTGAGALQGRDATDASGEQPAGNDGQGPATSEQPEPPKPVQGGSEPRHRPSHDATPTDGQPAPPTGEQEGGETPAAAPPPPTPAAATGDDRTPPERPPSGGTGPASNPPELPPSGQPGTGRPGEKRGESPRRRGGLLMGRPFGVPVYVAPSWFLVAALITWVFGGQLDRVLPHLGIERYLIALFFAVAFYASVLVHELAHTVVALRFKLPVRRIQLQFFGGVSEIEKEAETPGREFWLAFVGPLLSLVLGAVFYGGLQLVEPATVPAVILAALTLSNLIVAVFNLLPGLPLDGGRMLRAVVWKLSGRPMVGTVAAVWTGRVLALAVLVGLPLATRARGGGEELGGVSSLTDALLAAILAAIIWTGAGNSLRMARLRERLPQLSARTLTRRAVPVTPDTPLSEALRRANEAGARALVVVGGHGEPISLVRESAIVGVPEHRRPWVAVGTLAQDLTEGMRVSAELVGEELLEHLRTTPATEYLVVEETGEIYGVLSTADVERAFVKAMSKRPG